MVGLLLKFGEQVKKVEELCTQVVEVTTSMKSEASEVGTRIAHHHVCYP